MNNFDKKSLVLELTKKQKERYARNILLKEIGVEGQLKLLNSKVLIIGAGGLGSPCALYLASVGVGCIGLVDDDQVDLSNLQRQIIHSTNNLGKDKVISAKERINDLNPDVKVNVYKDRVNEDNIKNFICDYDFVVDASDNFKTKFLINDCCVKEKKPFCHGAILEFKGQLMTYIPNKGPCYRCVFNDIPPESTVKTAKKVGVIGTIPGIIGSLQAMEVIKYICEVGDTLNGYLLTYDGLKQHFSKIKLPNNCDCPICKKYK